MATSLLQAFKFRKRDYQVAKILLRRRSFSKKIITTHWAVGASVVEIGFRHSGLVQSNACSI